MPCLKTTCFRPYVYILLYSFFLVCVQDILSITYKQLSYEIHFEYFLIACHIILYTS